MNSRIRHLIRKLVQEANKAEENEYYIDTIVINEGAKTKNGNKKFASVSKRKSQRD